MPTIIDSLIVKLGLDKKDYDVGSEKVKKSLKETGVEAEKAGTGIKKHIGKEGSASFDSIAKSAVKFLAVIGGTYAVKQFIEQTVESSAALDRLSKNLGESAQSLSAWSQASEIAGGTASGLQGTMAMLSRAQTELALTGETSLRPYFNFLRVAMADSAGGARPVSEILLDLAERFSHMDRIRAFNVGQMMGIDPGTMNLLLEGRKSVEAMIGRQKEYSAVTKQQAEESSRTRAKIIEIRQEFEAFGRQLLSDALPALEWLLNKFEAFGKWCHENKDFVEKFLTVLAVGLGAIAIAALPLTGTIALITALAAAIALVWQDYDIWKKGGKSFIDWEKWGPEIKMATEALEKMRHLLWAISRYTFAGQAIRKLFPNFATQEDAENAAADKKAAAKESSSGTKPEGWFKRNFGHLKDTYENSYRRRKAMEYFQGQGWTKEQAAGIVANLQAESALQTNPKGSNDGGKAYGMAQWHGDRQADFQKIFGHPIQQATADEQLQFVQWELTHTESNAGNRLKQSKTAEEAGAAVSKYYERPADREANALNRGRLAAGIAGASDAASGAGAAMSAQSKAPVVGPQSSSSVQTHIGEINVHTQATDADGIAKDMGKSMDYLFTSQANYGLV